MEHLKHLASKIASGRLWLVFITGWVFAWATIHAKLPPEAVATIITMVFTSYFSRNDRNGGSGGKTA